MNLPDEVQTQFQLALIKTGWTLALEKAIERLPVILSMRPETFEAYCATRIDETLT